MDEDDGGSVHGDGSKNDCTIVPWGGVVHGSGTGSESLRDMCTSMNIAYDEGDGQYEKTEEKNRLRIRQIFSEEGNRCTVFKVD